MVETEFTTTRARSRADARKAAAESPSGYRIDVHCGEVADVVQYVGGWLFDQLMAGWQVHISVGAGQDVKPLQILGIGTWSDLLAEDLSQDGSVTPYRAILAVAAAVLDQDEDLRTEVADALRSGTAEVLVWGNRMSEGWERGKPLSDVEYAMSIAARAFKAHALKAAAVQADSARSIEIFRCSTPAVNQQRRPGSR